MIQEHDVHGVSLPVYLDAIAEEMTADARIGDTTTAIRTDLAPGGRPVGEVAFDILQGDDFVASPAPDEHVDLPDRPSRGHQYVLMALDGRAATVLTCIDTTQANEGCEKLLTDSIAEFTK